jgi:hypothetical protein
VHSRWWIGQVRRYRVLCYGCAIAERDAGDASRHRREFLELWAAAAAEPGYSLLIQRCPARRRRRRLLA